MSNRRLLLRCSCCLMVVCFLWTARAAAFCRSKTASCRYRQPPPFSNQIPFPSRLFSSTKPPQHPEQQRDRKKLHKKSDKEEELDEGWTPWNSVGKKLDSKQAARFRQHVNPLSRRYQLQAILPDDWPHSVYNDCSRDLHLDIGCGKGGFLIEYAKAQQKENGSGTPSPTNYLGLEIRPGVADLARERLHKHGLQGILDFVGCNANVDLDRLLSLYPGRLSMVSIQFPDPHFKTQHAKRRVVRASLVETLAKHMLNNHTSQVFLQSDVKVVFDDMYKRFKESVHFDDLTTAVDDDKSNMPNVLGVPTERETSVLKQSLPVYRGLFRRNNRIFP